MSSGRPVVHQDYIAKIRYSNALPPPPCPPKLLDIPNTGLSSGQYTSASFASRLAREQPLNIEADAELGMPIDLVGIPKVFDGDESAIQAMPNPPPLHPSDRPLMRNPNALGKGATNAAAVTFLRRTEYVTSSTTGGSKFESTNSSNTMRIRKKRKAETDINDPIHIARNIVKGFNIAYPADAYNGQDNAEELKGAEITSEERAAWNKPRNPNNPSAKLLDSYPLLPDWDATPDTGGYMMFKFSAPPINNPLDRSYDPRLDVALLRPAGQTVADSELFEKERDEYRDDPSAPIPIPRYQFEFFLPSSRDKVAGIKRNFTTFNPDDEDDIDFDLGDEDESGVPRKCFKYENIRTYETSQQVGDPVDTYGDVVALSLHDPQKHDVPRLRDARLQKGAYFYPVIQKTVIRSRRPGRVELVGEEQKVDVIEAAGREPQAEAAKREIFRKRAEGVEV